MPNILNPEDVDLPRGNDPLYQAMRNAGLSGSKPQRNVHWIGIADDGVTVFNAWRCEMETRKGEVVAVVDPRSWSTKRGTAQKRQAVIDGLQENDGGTIRVVVLEGEASARRHSGARYDDGALWCVEDTGDEFLLWRGRPSMNLGPSIPGAPAGFGNISPDRKEVVSRRIERNQRVRLLTFRRARNRCELTDCSEQTEFASLDVHHMTRLGDGGTDHTDNTVALCPACHAKIHRGTDAVKSRLELQVESIRHRRSN